MASGAVTAGKFDNVELAPRDAILGLGEAFRNDPRPGKINLSVGVYQTESGETPILATVKEAESRLLAGEKSKSYLPIDGSPKFASAVQELLFGAGSEPIAAGRVATSHTPGGTGALRVAADFIKKLFPSATVWLSNPTWPNHPGIFNAAGLKTKEYPYFDPATSRIAKEKLLATLNTVAEGDFVLLHGCCHNPTGNDPDATLWEEIAETLRARGATPLIDFAYQGFAEGIREDAAALRVLCPTGGEALVASSLSKNFGLYNERVGALSVVASSRDAAERAQSQVKSCIRVNYSNPPVHGAAIATTILTDAELRTRWEAEVAGMRDRIATMRRQFVETLKAKGVQRDFSFIIEQRGMFSYSGLTKEQVGRLRDEFAIYAVDSGRINVAGMSQSNIEPLCAAIAKVL